MEISFFLHASIKHQLLSTCLKPFLNDSDRFVLRLVCKELNKLLPRRNNSKELMEDFMKKKGYYYLYSIFFKPNDNGLCFIALSTRDENVQKELILKTHLQSKHMNYAASYGNLILMKWLKENGFPWNQSTFICATSNGNLDNMKWLKENNCPWNRSTFSSAAFNGNLNNMKWLKDNNCPWDEWTFYYATKYGNFDIIKWLKDNNCPWDEWTFYYAVKYENLDIMKWLKENGCPYGKNMCLVNSKSDIVKEWINENL